MPTARHALDGVRPPLPSARLAVLQFFASFDDTGKGKMPLDKAHAVLDLFEAPDRGGPESVGKDGSFHKDRRGTGSSSSSSSSGLAEMRTAVTLATETLDGQLVEPAKASPKVRVASPSLPVQLLVHRPWQIGVAGGCGRSALVGMTFPVRPSPWPTCPLPTLACQGAKESPKIKEKRVLNYRRLVDTWRTLDAHSEQVQVTIKTTGAASPSISPFRKRGTSHAPQTGEGLEAAPPGFVR